MEKPGSLRWGCLARLILISAQSPSLNRTMSSARRTGRRAQNLVLMSGLSGAKDMLVYVRKISELCGTGQVFKYNQSCHFNVHMTGNP